MALARLELEKVTRSSRHAFTALHGGVDLSFDDDDSRPLVDLVLLQFLPGWEVQQDHPRILARGKDLRFVRFDPDRSQVPTLHLHAPSSSADSCGNYQRASRRCWGLRG